MIDLRNARGLPASVPYLALAGLFVASQFAFPLYEILPIVPLVASMALLAVGLYWLIAMACLRSDPRIWRPESAWYRANLKPFAAGERDASASAIRDELAPRLQREFGSVGMVAAIVLAILCMWLAGLPLGLRRGGEKD